MKHLKHWQDPVNALIGAWLLGAPWALGFHGHTAARLATIALGALLLVSSLGEIAVPEAWEEWLDFGLGLLLVAAPWMSGFTEVGSAMQNAIVCGLAVAALSLWVLATDDEYGGWLHRLVR
jgi:hypothetical protein